MTTTSTIKPILFSTEMVQAILDCRKSQTRRICNPQPKEGFITSEDWNEIFWTSKIKIGNTPDRFEITETFKPKYQIGDILWVRETFFPFGDDFIHKANSLASDLDVKWKPSLFMPKEACRIFLKVTNVRCERLRDISEEDAINEGIKYFNHGYGGSPRGVWYHNYKYNTTNCSPKYSFETLWDSINLKKAPWKSNPWVWVYEFEVTEKPENFLP